MTKVGTLLPLPNNATLLEYSLGEKRKQACRIEEEMEKEPQESVEQLRNERQGLTATIRAQEEEIQALKEQLAHLKGEHCNGDSGGTVESNDIDSDSLSAEQIERYSRQLLLNDGFGVKGQRKLLSSSVLVIGAGGIGSTGKQYYEKMWLVSATRSIIHTTPAAACSAFLLGSRRSGPG